MRIIILLSLLLSSSAFGQILSGELKDEGRKLLSQETFVKEGRVNGFVKYELAVNREGEVTSATLVDTDIKSTPAKFELKNHAMTLKFQKGTHYPKFHHVVVRFTSVKGK